MFCENYHNKFKENPRLQFATSDPYDLHIKSHIHSLIPLSEFQITTSRAAVSNIINETAPT